MMSLAWMLRILEKVLEQIAVIEKAVFAHELVCVCLSILVLVCQNT